MQNVAISVKNESTFYIKSRGISIINSSLHWSSSLTGTNYLSTQWQGMLLKWCHSVIFLWSDKIFNIYFINVLIDIHLKFDSRIKVRLFIRRFEFWLLCVMHCNDVAREETHTRQYIICEWNMSTIDHRHDSHQE